jgi:hypothetical protein
VENRGELHIRQPYSPQERASKAAKGIKNYGEWIAYDAVHPPYFIFLNQPAGKTRDYRKNSLHIIDLFLLFRSRKCINIIGK